MKHDAEIKTRVNFFSSLDNHDHPNLTKTTWNIIFPQKPAIFQIILIHMVIQTRAGGRSRKLLLNNTRDNASAAASARRYWIFGWRMREREREMSQQRVDIPVIDNVRRPVDRKPFGLLLSVTKFMKQLFNSMCIRHGIIILVNHHHSRRCWFDRWLCIRLATNRNQCLHFYYPGVTLRHTANEKLSGWWMGILYMQESSVFFFFFPFWWCKWYGFVRWMNFIF